MENKTENRKTEHIAKKVRYVNRPQKHQKLIFHKSMWRSQACILNFVPPRNFFGEIVMLVEQLNNILVVHRTSFTLISY